MKLRFKDFQKKWNPEKRKMENAGSFYAIVDITPEELAQYKAFKNVDGKSYYNEENGYATWYSTEFYGFECCEVVTYKRKDGTIGFKASQPDVDALDVLAQQCDDPTEKSRLTAQKHLLMLKGKPFSGKANVSDDDGDDDDETVSAPKSKKAKQGEDVDVKLP